MKIKKMLFSYLFPILLLFMIVVFVAIGIASYGLEVMISPISTSILGFSAFLVAHQQWRTNEINARLSLYKERHEAYRAFKTLAASIVVYNDIDDKEIRKFMDTVEQNKFVLNSDVLELQKQMYEKALCFKTLMKINNNQSDARKEESYRDYFQNALMVVVDERFSDMLDFRDI